MNKKFLGRTDEFPSFKKREFQYDKENETISMRCIDSYSDNTECIISEEKFFMYIENCTKYYEKGHGNFDAGKETAEKYLLLKYRFKTSYTHSVLLFKNEKIEIVLHYNKLVLRNFKEYDDCGEEVTVLLPNAEKKDINHYKDFIFHSLNELYDNAITKETVEKGICAAYLPECIQNMAFCIDLKKHCTLEGRSVLECFKLHKQKYKPVAVSISIGCGYPVGSHNPGAGWSFEIPGVYFKDCDIYGLSQYVSQSISKIPDNIYINETEFCKNHEIIKLIEIIRQSDTGKKTDN